MGFAGFAGQKYLSLESFKKNGAGVKTPVWFAAELSSSLDSSGAKLYIYTIGNTGKVKRIRNNPRVNIAPCNMRGTLLGDFVPALAEILTGSEAEHGMQLLNKKSFPSKQILDFFSTLRPRPGVVMSLRPA